MLYSAPIEMIIFPPSLEKLHCTSGQSHLGHDELSFLDLPGLYFLTLGLAFLHQF
jgi:hypothetical protein